MVWSAEEESSLIDYYRGKLSFFPSLTCGSVSKRFVLDIFIQFFYSAFILLAWRQGVAVARGKAAKDRFVSVHIFIFCFTRVQLTERIFISDAILDCVM